MLPPRLGSTGDAGRAGEDGVTGQPRQETELIRLKADDLGSGLFDDVESDVHDAGEIASRSATSAPRSTTSAAMWWWKQDFERQANGRRPVDRRTRRPGPRSMSCSSAENRHG